MKRSKRCAEKASPPQKGRRPLRSEPCCDSGCGGSTCSSKWANLAPEVLANIFSRLYLWQRLCIIPCVCKPWMHASLDPLGWQVLDLRGFPSRTTDRLVDVLLRRTGGHLREFIFPYMTNPDWLKVIENSAPVLQKLHIPCSCDISEWAINVASSMTSITDLAISNINGVQLSSEALEAFGKNCKCITHLRWSDHSCGVRSQNMSDDPCKDDVVAFMIAQNYPSLKHLELQYNFISPQGVRAILHGCPMLEHLNLVACVMDMDESLLRECWARLCVFLEPRSTNETSDDEDEDEDDEDDNNFKYEDYYRCGVCCRFIEMRDSSPSRSDHSSGSCDSHVCCIEDLYHNETTDEEDEDEEEDEDDDEGKDDHKK